MSIQTYCRRNQNYISILRFLNLGDKKISPFDITNQFTHLFWLGDLNYRVEMQSTVSSAAVSEFWQQSLYTVDSELAGCQVFGPSAAHYCVSLHRKRSTWWQRSNSSSTRNSSAKTSSVWRGARARSFCILVSAGRDLLLSILTSLDLPYYIIYKTK